MCRSQLGGGIADDPESPLHRGKQDLTRGRQHNAAWRRVHQLLAHPMFEIVDMPTNDRVTDTYIRRRLSHAPRAPNGFEGAQHSQRWQFGCIAHEWKL